MYCHVQVKKTNAFFLQKENHPLDLVKNYKNLIFYDYATRVMTTQPVVITRKRNELL